MWPSFKSSKQMSSSGETADTGEVARTGLLCGDARAVMGVLGCPGGQEKEAFPPGLILPALLHAAARGPTKAQLSTLFSAEKLALPPIIPWGRLSPLAWDTELLTSHPADLASIPT